MQRRSGHPFDTSVGGQPGRASSPARRLTPIPASRDVPPGASDGSPAAVPDGGPGYAGASSSAGEEAPESNEPPPGGPASDAADVSDDPSESADAVPPSGAAEEHDAPEGSGPGRADDDGADGDDEDDDDGDDESGRHDPDAVQVLEFALAGATYAVTIGEVGAIVEMKDITRFPRGPDGVDGVTDLRGEITAVLDPKRLLDVPTDEGPSADDNIVVLDRTEDKQKVAIRVDDVERVETYAEDRIDRNGNLQSLEVESLDANMITGVVRKENEAGVDLVPWLNIDALVANVD